MCPTKPQKDVKGNEPFSGSFSRMEFLGSMGARKASCELTPNVLFTLRSLSCLAQAGALLLLSPQGGTPVLQPQGPEGRSSNDLAYEALESVLPYGALA